MDEEIWGDCECCSVVKELNDLKASLQKLKEELKHNPHMSAYYVFDCLK